MKKYTLKQLQNKYKKCLVVQDRTSKFLDFQNRLHDEILNRMRAKIFTTCCKCLKNTHGNQFLSAAFFADKAMEEIFATDNHYEIGSYYTKSKNPVVVFFE